MPKINLKDKVNDNELDLSLCDIHDVPVKDIAAIKRVTSVDLSNNKIIILTDSFATSLSRLVKLDLSQNQLQSLPDNFGNLKNLRELDLYNNKLQHLPLSLGQCKLLKWLDLKNNPLVPAISEVAGPCLDAKQCQMCAKKIVPFLNNMQVQLDKEVERRNAQRKRDLELRDAQQSQNKKEQQKIAKKAAKVEKKQKENAGDQNQVNRGKTHPSVIQNGQVQQNENSKRSFISEMFKVLFSIFLMNALITLLLYKYDPPRFLLVQKYFLNAWNSTKAVLPPGVQEKLDEGGSKIYFYSEPILANIKTVLNSVTAKIYDFYSKNFNEEYIQNAGKAIYAAYAYTINSVVSVVKNFLKELPEIIEVIQKRLLG